jgi:hypothetical protein
MAQRLRCRFHGKRVSDDLIVRVLACLAEGLGIRGTARVFEIDPNTVLSWLIEAADQLRAFAQSFLHDLHLRQADLPPTIFWDALKKQEVRAMFHIKCRTGCEFSGV